MTFFRVQFLRNLLCGLLFVALTGAAAAAVPSRGVPGSDAERQAYGRVVHDAAVVAVVRPSDTGRDFEALHLPLDFPAPYWGQVMLPVPVRGIIPPRSEWVGRPSATMPGGGLALRI